MMRIRIVGVAHPPLTTESNGRTTSPEHDDPATRDDLVEIMMRLKKAKNFDARSSALIENAYYTCLPPEVCTVMYCNVM